MAVKEELQRRVRERGNPREEVSAWNEGERRRLGAFPLLRAGSKSVRAGSGSKTGWVLLKAGPNIWAKRELGWAGFNEDRAILNSLGRF